MKLLRTCRCVLSALSYAGCMQHHTPETSSTIYPIRCLGLAVADNRRVQTEGGRAEAARSNGRLCRGLSLVEVLVAISVIGLLLAILVPALTRAKDQARRLLSMGRQKQVVTAVTVYAFDHEDCYPESVATIGRGSGWNWHDPRMITAEDAAYAGRHRAMSEYLGGYIENAAAVYCPSAPGQYKYLQSAWDAGDAWDNPTSPFPRDRVVGVFCFYWNYTGLIEDGGMLFRGPETSAGSPGQSRLIVSDYFGYRDLVGGYGSCEKFKGAQKSWPDELLAGDSWLRPAGSDLSSPRIQLRAGYSDGHVETYSSAEVVTMKIVMMRQTNQPYPDGVGPGIFFLPKAALPGR